MSAPRLARRLDAILTRGQRQRHFMRYRMAYEVGAVLAYCAAFITFLFI